MSGENLIVDQGIFSYVIILLILITYLLKVYGYCLEKFDLGHYWDLKGYKGPKAALMVDLGLIYMEKHHPSHVNLNER